jgi:hypothetical protein
MNGSSLEVVFHIQVLGYESAKFSLQGSKQAINLVLGRKTKVKPDEAQEEQDREVSERIKNAKKRSTSQAASRPESQVRPAVPAIQPVMSTELATEATEDATKTETTSATAVPTETKTQDEPVLFEEASEDDDSEDIAASDNKHSVVLVRGPHENSEPPRFVNPTTRSPLETVPFDTDDFFEAKSTQAEIETSYLQNSTHRFD